MMAPRRPPAPGTTSPKVGNVGRLRFFVISMKSPVKKICEPAAPVKG
jgi:hypothetical protein